MEKNHLLSLFILSFFLIISSCDTAGDDDAIISGQVTDATTGDALSDATVAITSPDELSDFARTDEEGNYEISGINVNDVTSVTLTASFTDYNSVSKDITLTPDATEDLDFRLSEVGTDDGGSNIPAGEPGGAASIILNDGFPSPSSINIKETGGTVNSTFNFTVVDSLGRPLNTEGAVDVQFSIIKGPGGGESLLPAIKRTNTDGQVETVLVSGDSAGVVQVRAMIERPDIGLTIVSEPIAVAINGGFPSPDRFFIATENKNLEGYGLIAETLQYEIFASVGDQFGNPVKVGTSVDFRSDIGGIVGGDSQTDERGIASIFLRPEGAEPNSDPSGIGFFNVRAHTIDHNNDDQYRFIKILYTTPQAIISVNPGNVNIPANGSQAFTYTVTDMNGNPMSAGSQFSVSVATGLEATGNVGFTLGDFTTTGPGKTEFGFTVSDTDDENSDVNTTSILITVVSAGTNSPTTLSISGSRAKAGGWTFNPSNTETEFIEGRR